jgi:Kef-type K+ transport system membrane component KefB
MRAVHANFVRDIAVCIGSAWLLGMLAQLGRQPVLLAYLVAGVIIGPLALGLVQDTTSIHSIAELGLMFLLFMIGLEIDLKKLVQAGKVVTVTAAVQILGGCLVGVGVFRLLGYPLGSGHWEALYLAVAAALSSTVIIVKVLYDRRELDTLAGRVTLGILVVQDLFAILFLAVQPNLGTFRFGTVLLSLGQAGVLLAVALAASRFLLPPVFKTVARVPELLLVGALAWCFAIAELAQALHLSREMGALVAGVSISTFPYAVDVISRVTTLRDFFVTLFFVSLGMLIPQPTWQMIALCLVFSLFVLVSRFVTVFIPLHRMGQGLRMSVLPALYLCQVSEFSLVILQLGRDQGHISPDLVGAVGLSFVLLAAISTWGMTHAEPTTRWAIRRLQACGLRDLDAEERAAGSAGGAAENERKPRILLLGFYRTASALLEELSRNAPELLKHLAVVDFNPEVRERLRTRAIRVIYGDISQPDTLRHAGVQGAELLVCTIPDSLLKGTTNARLVRTLRELNPPARIIAVSETLAGVGPLRAAGADYVSVPRLAEAAELWFVVREAERGSLEALRATVEQRFQGRQEVLP